MCGFFGYFSLKKKNNKEIYKNSTLKHRGPDEHNVFTDNNIHCEFFRLNILGGKYGKQPMLSKNKRYLLLFNGEIYNYKELAKNYLSIERKDYSSDTRVILDLFTKYGPSAVEKFNGMFAIVLYDLRLKKLFLIRDRFGTKPLYYLIENNIIYFSSEIKGIPVKKNVNNKVVRDYLDLGLYPNNKTFFSKINNLKPSSYLIYCNNVLKVCKYFDLKKEVILEKNNKIDSLEKFEHLLNDSISIRQRSNRTLNFHLSGGIDSTSLLVLTNNLWKKNYNLSTNTYVYKGFSNSEYQSAKKISSKLNLKNQKVEIESKEIPALAEKLQYYQDEPFGGIASIAEYKQNLEQKKKEIIVSFEGIGGDEILSGYKSHLYILIWDLYHSQKNNHLLNKLVKFSGRNIKNILLIAKNFILSDFNGNTDLSQIRNNETNKKIDKNKNYYKAITFNEIDNGSLFRTLRFRDRSSAACGRELRFPFLDHKLVTHCLAMPIELKFKDGMSKAPLRHIVNTVDKKLSLEKKISANSAQSFWFQNDLKNWAMDNITALSNKNVINKRYFENIDYYLKPPIKNTFYIWQLVNLNIFYDTIKKNI